MKKLRKAGKCFLLGCVSPPPLFTLSVAAPPEAATCVGGHPHLLKITLFFGLVQTRLKARLLPSFLMEKQHFEV